MYGIVVANKMTGFIHYIGNIGKKVISACSSSTSGLLQFGSAHQKSSLNKAMK